MLGIIRFVYSTATNNNGHAFFTDRPEGIIESINHCIDISINGIVSASNISQFTAMIRDLSRNMLARRKSKCFSMGVSVAGSYSTFRHRTRAV